MLKKPKMKIRFAADDWAASFDELKEKEEGLRSRLFEAHRTMNMLRDANEIAGSDKLSAIDHAKKAIEDYKNALEEVEKLIMRRKSGTA